MKGFYFAHFMLELGGLARKKNEKHCRSIQPRTLSTLCCPFSQFVCSKFVMSHFPAFGRWNWIAIFSAQYFCVLQQTYFTFGIRFTLIEQAQFVDRLTNVTISSSHQYQCVNIFRFIPPKNPLSCYFPNFPSGILIFDSMPLLWIDVDEINA